MAALYAALFLGSQIIGLVGYLALLRRVRAFGVKGLVLPLFIIFCGYGCVWLFLVSAVFGVWSGMHSLAFAALIFFLLPTLLFYAVKFYSCRAQSVFHRGVFLLSALFPAAVAAWVGVSYVAK